MNGQVGGNGGLLHTARCVFVSHIDCKCLSTNILVVGNLRSETKMIDGTFYRIVIIVFSNSEP
jgi:hypothetical protein